MAERVDRREGIARTAEALSWAAMLFFTERRRKKLREAPFAPGWLAITDRNVALKRYCKQDPARRS